MAACDAWRVATPSPNAYVGQARRPAFRQAAGEASLQLGSLGREGGAVRGEPRASHAAGQLRAPCRDRPEVRADLVGDVELAVGVPAVGDLRQADLVRPERRAVRLRAVLLVRRAVGDVVRTAMRLGRSSAHAVSMAASIASRSFPSSTRLVLQPYASNRARTSSSQAIEVGSVELDVVVVAEADELAQAQVPGQAAPPRPRCPPGGHRPSRGRTSGGRSISWPGRLNSAARRRSAMAIPTAFEIPWPRGPVVASIPGAAPYSGCPGVRDPSWRKRFSSSSGRS